MKYYPISSTLQSDTAPIEFETKGQGNEYIDLSQTYLQMVCKFTKDDGTNLTVPIVPRLPLIITSYIHCLRKSM